MNKLYDFFGGRKLTFAILLMVVSGGFVFFNKFTAQEWVEFMIWVFGTYAVGNVGEHLSKRIKK